MHIILRKVGGHFDAFFRSSGSAWGMAPGDRSHSSSAGIGGGLMALLTSPLVLAVLLFAFLAMWALSHPLQLAHAGYLGAIPMMGSVKIRELREKRANLVTLLREITNTAEKESRALNAEEETRYSKLFGDVDEIRKSIEREEQLVEVERSVAGSVIGAPPAAAGGTSEQRANPRGTEEYRKAVGAYIVRGRNNMSPEEQRALSVGNDASGGFTTVHEQFVNELLKGVDNILWIRQLARKLSVPTAQTLGVMTLDADPDDADWTSELAVGNEDTGMATGKRKLTPHPLAKFIKVSNDFLRQTMTGGETLVRDRLAYKFGVSQEKGFMTGDGVQKALGIFTASADGIPTTRDVSTGNLSTTPTFDGLLAAKYALKQAYWNDKLRWVFHRDVMLKITQLKDGDGQYLWKESVRVGEPDKILNFGIAMSEYAPNTMTTGQYVGALGNFEYYWIADAYDLAIRRLDELFALTNQVGFVGRMAVDGQPMLAEAFVRVKLT